MRFIGIETLVDGSIATIRRLPSSYDKVTLISSRQEDSARNIANLMGASSDAEVIARCADYRKRFRYTPLGFIYTKCGFAYDIDRRELGFVGNDTSQLEGFSVFPSVSESFSKMEETNFFLMSILARAGCIDMSRIKVDYIAGQIRDIQPDFIPREEGVYYASPDERRLAIAVSVAQQKWFEHLGTGKEAWLSAENHWISGGYPFALETILYPGDIMEFLSGMNTSERIRCMEEYFAYLTNLYGLTGDEDDPIPESVWGETAGASAENERKILRRIRQTLEDNHTPAA